MRRATPHRALAVLLAASVMTAASAAQAFYRRQGTASPLVDEHSRRLGTPWTGSEVRHVLELAEEVRQIPVAAESFSTEIGPPVTQGERESCKCCRGGPLVSNASFINTRSPELDRLLRRNGVLGCDELDLALDVTSMVAIPGSGHNARYRGSPKQHVSSMHAGKLRDGRGVMVFECAGNCHRLGVGTMLATKASAFTIDLVGYCAASAGKQGVYVTELMQPQRVGEHDDCGFGFVRSVSQYVVTALAVLGSVKEMNHKGRLLSDYGTRQYMMAADRRMKLSDIDCTSEDHQENGMLSWEGSGTGDLDQCLWRHLPTNARLRLDQTNAKAAWRFEERFDPALPPLWRSPRRDVMLAAGVLCYMAESTCAIRDKSRPVPFSGEQDEILHSLFATAIDPTVELSLDGVREAIMGLVPDVGDPDTAGRR
jgi:hypothetical protein